MSREAVEHLCDTLQDRIDYFRQEYDLSYAEVVGVLEVIKMGLWQEMQEANENDGE